MVWNEVKSYLLDNVINFTSDRNNALNWLTALETTYEGKLLATNIAIDIKSKALESRLFITLINDINYLTTNPSLAFANSIAKNVKKLSLILNSKHDVEELQHNNHYLRIMELGSFIDYYIKPNELYSSTNPTDVAEVRQKYFKRRKTLEKVREWWMGSAELVFVTSSEDFDAHIAASRKSDWGTVVNDVYGIGYNSGVGFDGKPELICINYPFRFSVAVFQPTTIDGWASDKINLYYVSHGKNNGWGKAKCLTGDNSDGIERVHSYFKGLNSDYSTKYLGESELLIVDYDGILNEAFKRFNNCN